MRVYQATLATLGTCPCGERRPRRDCKPIFAKAIAAFKEQPWIRFNSQTEAKRLCFGHENTVMFTGISKVLKGHGNSCLGWNFKF